MKIVGLSCNTEDHKTTLNNAYVKAFTRDKILPFILPNFVVENREGLTAESFAERFKDEIKEVVSRIDALVLTGGQDINPNSFSEENGASCMTDSVRDFTELALLNECSEQGKPVMGICRGLQVIAKQIDIGFYQQDLGGSQELHSGTTNEIKIRQEAAHPIYLYGELKEYLKADRITVNSWHHQGATLTVKGSPQSSGKRLTEIQTIETGEFILQQDFKILATTDSVIEAFESRKEKIFAVQWHPEEYGPTSRIISYFIENFLK